MKPSRTALLEILKDRQEHEESDGTPASLGMIKSATETKQKIGSSREKKPKRLGASSSKKRGPLTDLFHCVDK